MANSNTPAAVDPSKSDEFTAALQAAGFLNAGNTSEFHRVRMQGSNLIYNDEVIGVYNAKTKEPALIVRITDAPAEYQSMWFEPALAMAVERPEVSGRFCKSHFDDPQENRKYSEAYNGKRASCDDCPVSPFVRPENLPQEAKDQDGASKCSWKADIEFQIVDRDDEGNLTQNDDTIYTFSLSTTGIIEFKGSSSRKGNPLAGVVSEENFMVQLAKLGIEKWGKEGLLKAHTALRMGGVIAELRLPTATNPQDKSRSWNVPSFTPIDILETQEQPALEGGDDTENASAATTDDDDVPF